jgi:hypothetical protein
VDWNKQNHLMLRSGFVVGSANNVVYKGALLAEEQDVVVVGVK